MSAALLIRLAGLAAILAGVLRVGTSFLPAATGSSAPLEWLYLIIDVTIMFALIGIYAYQHAESGILGFLGFVLSVAGTESIGGPDGKIGGLDVYRAGSMVIGVGLVLLAAGSWRAAKLPRYVPVLWIVSTLVGMTTFVAEGSGVPFLIAGITLGLGFTGAGLRLWTEPASSG